MRRQRSDSKIHRRRCACALERVLIIRKAHTQRFHGSSRGKIRGKSNIPTFILRCDPIWGYTQIRPYLRDSEMEIIGTEFYREIVTVCVAYLPPYFYCSRRAGQRGRKSVVETQRRRREITIHRPRLVAETDVFERLVHEFTRSRRDHATNGENVNGLRKPVKSMKRVANRFCRYRDSRIFV